MYTPPEDGDEYEELTPGADHSDFLGKFGQGTMMCTFYLVFSVLIMIN